MKKFLSFILAVAMSFSCVGVLSGCSNSSEGEEEVESVISTDEGDAPAKSYDGIDEIKEEMLADVNATVDSLNAGLDNLLAEIDSFDAYKENIDLVDEYYSTIVSETFDLCIRLREYAIAYAEIILNSDETPDEMRDGMDTIYDDIYNGALDIVYDDIYDDLVGDKIYDAFYDGIISDAYDSLEFSEYSSARSDEFDRRSNCRSSVFDVRSDCRSDIFDFRSDLRSELFADDVDGAYEVVEEFREYVNGLSEGLVSTEDDEQSAVEESISSTDEEANDESESEEVPSTDTTEELVDGMRPSFKQAMDDYEAFYDEYCEFMEMYQDNSSDVALIAQYATLLAKMAEMNASFEEWEDEDLNDAELQYYIEVNSRVAQKLLEVAE